MPADLDADFQALLASAQKAPAARGAGATKSTYDPSAGGGTLNIAGWDTGVKTPQWLDRTLAGAGQGMTDIVRHAGNLVGLESDQALRDAKETDAPLLNTTAGRIGQFIGQTAASAPIGMGTSALLGRLGGVGASLAGNAISSGAIQGAVQGGIMADPGQRGQGMVLGGLTGAAVPAIAGGIGKIARGLTRTPEAQALLDKGVDLTVGQMNPTGMANRMEQAAEGAFGVGDLVQNARQNAMGQYTRAMVGDAMPPGHALQTASHDFNDLLDEAATKFGSAYDAAKGFPVGAKIVQVKGGDIPLTKALEQVAAKPRIGLTADARDSWGQQLTDQLQEAIKSARRSGGMKSDDLISFRSTIRDAIRGEAGTDNASRAARSLLSDAEDKVTQALDSQLPTKVAQGLKATDGQYAKFAILRNAAKVAKDAPGGPTPFQISSAIAKATDSNAYARGGGLGRDLSKAAMSTFQSNVPRTGLAGVGRLAAIAAPLGAVGMAHPLALAPAAGAALLDLTSTGRRLAAGSTGGQQALAALLARFAPPASVQNLPGLYARSGLLGLAAPRLQQGLLAEQDQ